MLDIKIIRKEPEKVEALIQRKEPGITLSRVLELDEKVRHIKSETEELKHLRNGHSKKIGELIQKKEPSDPLKEEVRQIGEKISQLDQELASVEEMLTKELSKIPNLPEEDVKISQEVAENEVIKTYGEKPQFEFSPKHHLELNEFYHFFDFHRSAKTSGSGWPAYTGIGARLEWALINYMVDIQLLNGFQFWLPPLLVHPHIMFGSGQIPKFDGQYYEVADDEQKLYLIPTSEVVLNGLHYDEIIPEENLPLKYASFSPCFRKEAGAAGEKERGLIRMHQFHKVEMFSFCKPEQGQEIFEEMLSVAEEILKGLGLHYRLCKLVTGDMSFTASKTVDIEVWLPGQDRYYEVSSVSYCTDYQARRSNCRFKGKTGKPELVHTLNGSGLATPRLLVAILENNQNADGSIRLPPILAEKLGVHELYPE